MEINSTYYKNCMLAILIRTKSAGKLANVTLMCGGEWLAITKLQEQLASQHTIEHSGRKAIMYTAHNQ